VCVEVEVDTLTRTDDFAQRQLNFMDHTQWRSEVICSVGLFQGTTPQIRAHKTQPHPVTVRRLVGLREGCESVVLAELHCRCDLKGRKVKDVPAPVTPASDEPVLALLGVLE
jgi:hypothetical protein